MQLEFMIKEINKTFDLLDELDTTSFGFSIDNILSRRPVGVHEINTISALQAHVDVLTIRLDKFTTNAINSMV